MKELSWWQKALSRVVDVPVETRTSATGGIIYVSQYKGAWHVSNDYAVRGWGLCYEPFKTAFEFLEIWKKPIERVLILGAATGSVAQLLARHNQQFNIDAVEADTIMQQLASEVLPAQVHQQLHWHTTSGIEYLQNCSQTYDLIVVDELHEDSPTPELCQQLAFEKLKKQLNAGGHLLLHHPAGKHRLKQAANALFSGAFQHSFPTGIKRSIGDAVVLIATK